MSKNVYGALLLMILTIYLIRLLPFLFLRKPIKNRWFRSFLYYVPYVTLSVMTFPAILSAAETPAAGAAALIVGVIVAWFRGDLFTVALTCCAVVFLFELII
ncbi:MAG: AzlD domain-containing protein [Lachnospiraceae bacterium]|jgi:branched-subunit amino acid transport protein